MHTHVLTPDRCYRALDLPVKHDFLQDIDPTRPHRLYENSECLNKFNEWLKPRGLKLGLAELFYSNQRIPQRQWKHLDGIHFDDHVKINFVVNNGATRLSWWQPKPGTEHRELVTPVGSRYLEIHHDNSLLINEYECPITPTLVNAGSYHSVENLTASDRSCFSFNILHATDKPFDVVTWDQAMLIFKEEIREL